MDMQLPACFPDELLFSRILRHFTLSGSRLTNYLEVYWGARRASIHPLITSGLSIFSSRASENSEQLLHTQTLAPLFTYFLPSRAMLIKNAMLQGDCAAALRACQLPSFKQHAPLVLKYCPICSEQDLRKYGVTYWHRVQQIYGVTVCPKHRICLINKQVRGRARLSRELLPCTDGVLEEGSPEAIRFARYAADLLKCLSAETVVFDANRYLLKLKERGYVTRGHRIRRKRVRRRMKLDRISF
ncbi:hypothetical protein PsAD26_01111 [Pseudovibrio sp. Ad26]|nr:hypothetical protein PsAD26_01111 [Pseudovibrio sp. Ad26]